jgi:NADPH:quinone reductase-like Zn-dependent oxidoreductase
MQQLVLNKYGPIEEALALEEREVPSLSKGQVLVRMEFASISPSDNYLIQGFYGLHPELPFAMGLEGVGRVTLVAPGGDPGLLGQRVILVPNYEQGTWADEIAVAESSVVAVSDLTDALQLAMAAVNPASAWGLLNLYSKIGPGDWVAQTAGNSAVGQYVIALAARAGAKTLSVVRRESAADQVRAAGGDIAIIDGTNLAENVGAALGDEKLALVIDGVGGETVGILAHFLAPNKTAVNYSIQSGAEPHVSIADLIYNGVHLTGYWLVNWIRSTPPAEVRAVLASLAALVEQSLLFAEVEATYPLSEYKEAIAHALKTGKGGKVLFALNTE